MFGQVLRSATPKARKAHGCDNCLRVIEPGEVYERQTNIGDDGLYEWRFCAHCRIVWQRMWATDPELRYYDDGIDIGEYLDERGPTLVADQFRSRWRGVDAESLHTLWSEGSVD